MGGLCWVEACVLLNVKIIDIQASDEWTTGQIENIDTNSWIN